MESNPKPLTDRAASVSHGLKSLTFPRFRSSPQNALLTGRFACLRYWTRLWRVESVPKA